MRRATVLALLPLLVLTLAPVAWVFARSLDVAEAVARPAVTPAPEGARPGRLLRIDATPDGRVARVDLEAVHTVHVPRFQLEQLGLAVGETVRFRRRRDETGDVWREPPKGESEIGLRTGRVLEIRPPTGDRVPLVLDEEMQTDARWPEGVPAVPPGATVHVATEHRWGLDHYGGVLGGEREWELLGKSVVMALGVALVALALGFPLGVLTARTDLPGARWLAAAYVAPLLIPPYVAAIGWVRLLGATGLFTRLWRGDTDPTVGPLLPVYGLAGSIGVLALCWFPIVTLLTRVALARADGHADEAGLLVASPARVCWRLAAPPALAAAGAGAAFVFLFALSAFGAPSLLRFVVFSSDVFTASQTASHVGQSAAASMPLVVVATLALLALGFCERARAAAPVAPGRPPSPLPLGAWRWPAGVACWGLLALAAGVPLAALVWQAGGLTAFGDALTDMRPELRHSFVTSLATALGCAAVALPVGWVLARGRWREGGLYDLALLVPFAFPAAVLAAGMTELWNRGPLGVVYGTPAYLGLAIGLRTLPFAIRPVAVAARAVPRDAVEAGLLSGASGWQRCTALWAPLVGPGIASGALLVFILALSDLDTTLLARTPDWPTLQVRIFLAIHYGREDVVCAACVLLVALCVVPLAIYGLAAARKPRLL